MKPNKRGKRERKVKAWAVIRPNGKPKGGLKCGMIQTYYVFAQKNSAEFTAMQSIEKVVPCTITYKI